MISHPASPTPIGSTLLSLAVAICTAAPANAQQSGPQANQDGDIETVIVTASRRADPGAALPTAWSAVDQSALQRIAPQHSNQVFNRVAGSWVSRGNGQESLISLRSPVLTGAGSCGAFMTAQDGISLRSPGFCNVNQLFDANLLQAGKVEVLKGPATVVFGSNALHGIINVLTPTVAQTRNQVRIEAGSRDYYRLSASGSFDSIALSAQTARYGGYQDESGYKQQKATLRLDHEWQSWRVAGALEGAISIRRRRDIFVDLSPIKTTTRGKKTPIPRLTGMLVCSRPLELQPRLERHGRNLPEALLAQQQHDFPTALPAVESDRDKPTPQYRPAGHDQR